MPSKMLDFAMFVDSGKGYRKLSTHPMSIDIADKDGIDAALKGFSRAAAMWSSNYENYRNAKFAVFTSRHGRNDFKILQRI